MTWVLCSICAVAAAYQLVALTAVLRQLLRRDPQTRVWPPVSVLKPVQGNDPRFEEAIATHTRLDYPDYEILFGAGSEREPAMTPVRELLKRSPGKKIKLVVSREKAPNPKVAVLMELARHAKGTVWVVNDGDISVPPDYLRRIVAALEPPGAGLVTCLYRPVPSGLPAFWESIGIATDFAPSTLVAPLIGINEFGLGSTLCFRAADLERAGGFKAIRQFLADDYQLARRLTRGLRKRAVMARVVVDSALRYETWADLWRHQVRWARTVRVSRGDGYLGLPVTHAGLWAAVALGAGEPVIAAGLSLIRMLTGVTAGFVLLRCRAALALPLLPLWDLWAFFVWIAGLGGSAIVWRGRRMKLRRDGRLQD